MKIILTILLVASLALNIITQCQFNEVLGLCKKSQEQCKDAQEGWEHSNNQRAQLLNNIDLLLNKNDSLVELLHPPCH